MTSELTFVDTNVLVYGYDRSAGDKREVARRLVSDLWTSETGVLSSQVLQEFYVVTTRKLSMTRPRARQIIRRYGAWPVHCIDADDVLDASELEQRHSVSFWDALLVVAARRLGATRLVTEDLQDGRTIGGIHIENPFRG
jgi:predicted nucleic acid-binding protein